jgi:hypothetical protein
MTLLRTCGVALVLTFAACGGRRAVAYLPAGAPRDYRGTVQTRAASELPCSLGAVEVEQLGSGGYRALGCGQWISFTCGATATGDVCATNARGTLTPSSSQSRSATTPEQPMAQRPPADVPPDRAAREAVDERARAILACVGDDALALQISWSSTGALDALLQGDLQGSPQEQCVRGIIQQLSIPSPGEASTILHAVQR